ncbi:unnamed protein product, partial [Brassica oleracea var. botrytis]
WLLLSDLLQQQNPINPNPNQLHRSRRRPETLSDNEFHLSPPKLGSIFVREGGRWKAKEMRVKMSPRIRIPEFSAKGDLPGNSSAPIFQKKETLLNQCRRQAGVVRLWSPMFYVPGKQGMSRRGGDLMDMGLQPHNQHEQVITQSDNESLLPAFQATPLASTDNMNTCNTALKLEPDGAGQTSNTRTTRQKSSFMKTCLIHNKPGAQYIVGMEGYFLYKNIDKAQSMT